MYSLAAMCRMLACIGHTEIEDLLLTFRQLAITGKSTDGKGHRDGWGIGWYTNGNDCHLSKKAECASTSDLYMNTVKKVARDHATFFLAHLRKASPGTPVTDKETHPFQSDNLLFCHNGTIKKWDDQPLGEDLDTLLFFRKIQETSIERAINHFRRFKYTSLTCLLTDGRTIWAYRGFREKEDYYTLYYLKTEEFVLFCSEPIIQGEWVLLNNGELVTCSHLDITVKRLTS